MLWLNAVNESVSSSPNPAQHTAHWEAFCVQCTLNLTENLGSDVESDPRGETSAQSGPAWTLFRTGRDDCSLGSGRPRNICMFRIAAMYDFTVWGESPHQPYMLQKSKVVVLSLGMGP